MKICPKCGETRLVSFKENQMRKIVSTLSLMFGEYADYLTTLSVNDDPSLWDKYNLPGVPSWVIDDKIYPGKRSIETLKQLTGCK